MPTYPNPAGCPSKAQVNNFISQTQYFKYLGSFVAMQRADTHFGHNFQHANANSLHVAIFDNGVDGHV